MSQLWDAIASGTMSVSDKNGSQTLSAPFALDPQQLQLKMLTTVSVGLRTAQMQHVFLATQTSYNYKNVYTHLANLKAARRCGMHEPARDEMWEGKKKSKNILCSVSCSQGTLII